MKISKKIEFEACHHLPDEKCYGECSKMHWHSYKLETIIEGDITDKGWVINFSDLKTAIEEATKDYDHGFLNDYFEIPTAEIMVLAIARDIAVALSWKVKNFKSVRCKLWETSNSYAEGVCNINN